jgi:hypothetical protein
MIGYRSPIIDSRSPVNMNRIHFTLSLLTVSLIATIAPAAVFHPPVELTDQDGKPIVTKLGAGHPVILDWNGDGKMDLILGCKAGMMTMMAQALLLENVGTREAPRFRWPTGRFVEVGAENKCFSVGCGCNTGGTFECQPLDWNGDGYFDLIVNSRSRASLGAFLLLNTGKSRTEPRFERDRKLYAFAGHGHGSGGGDWNGDGIPDYCHHVNAGGWEVFLGSVGPGKTLRFALKPAIRSTEYRMIGPGAGVVTSVPRWFDNMVYACNFSGGDTVLAKPERLATFECERCRYPIEVDFGTPVTELVASLDDANNTRSLINRYRIDHRAKTVEFIETLAVCPANYARLSVGDLNQDGCMDVVYSGGVGGGQEPNTRIWVLYGKVKNVRESVISDQSSVVSDQSSVVSDHRSPQGADVRQLFTEPVALTDTVGKPLITRRSTGHPVICDWNGDRLNDLLIGCYSGMKTNASEILFFENKGTPAQPGFTWPPNQVMTHIAMPGATGPEPYRLSVDHPGTATLELHPCDQNGDGVMDLVVNSGKHRGLDVFVLEGKGGGSGVPTFGPWARFQNITKGEPQCSGGGDWNGDGVPDYVHYVNTEGWQVHPGALPRAAGETPAATVVGAGVPPAHLPRFATNAALSSASYRLVGLDRWFDRTPYAWPFSGAQTKGAAVSLASDCRDCGRSLTWSTAAAVTEIVASIDADPKPPKGTVSRSRIVYCRLDHTERTCTLLGTLAESDAAAVRLSIGDLNHDGVMDIVYTGGVSASGDETQVVVIYGKAKKIQ